MMNDYTDERDRTDWDHTSHNSAIDCGGKGNNNDSDIQLKGLGEFCVGQARSDINMTIPGCRFEQGAFQRIR